MDPVVPEIVGPIQVGLAILPAIIIAAVAALIAIVPFWKICSKAGFHGALSLLLLVPIANVVLPFYIAFAEWPALRNQQE